MLAEAGEYRLPDSPRELEAEGEAIGVRSDFLVFFERLLDFFDPRFDDLLFLLDFDLSFFLDLSFFCFRLRELLFLCLVLVEGASVLDRLVDAPASF